MAIKITEERKKEILNNFIENPSFYKVKDFKSVREIIVHDYRNDYEVLEKICETDKRRSLLSSTSLIHKIVTEVKGDRYEFRSEDLSEDLFFLIDQFNLHEDRFINSFVSNASIGFLTLVFQTIDKEIIQTNLLKDSESKIDKLFEFFKRVINNVNLKQPDQSKYQNLFNKVQETFRYDNYKNSSIWFKFYFFFHDKKKFENQIENNVLTYTAALIRSSTSPIKLKETIEEVVKIEKFVALSNEYLNEIYIKSTSIPEFGIEFYNIFNDEKKQLIIESWTDKSATQFKEVLESVKSDIPDRLKLAKKILSVSSRQSNVSVRESLYESFFLLDLTKEEIEKTEYSNQIINLVCNTDINLHRIGISEFGESNKYVNKITLKEKAIPFLINLLGNLNSYYSYFISILSLKIGIDKRQFNEELKKNVNYIPYINNYIVSSGNVDFYNIIISKVKNETIKSINNHFINSISYNSKFNDILKIIYNNKTFLSDNFHDKFADLYSNIR